jgi:hypothetical protein
MKIKVSDDAPIHLSAAYELSVSATETNVDNSFSTTTSRCGGCLPCAQYPVYFDEAYTIDLHTVSLQPPQADRVISLTIPGGDTACLVGYGKAKTGPENSNGHLLKLVSQFFVYSLGGVQAQG